MPVPARAKITPEFFFEMLEDLPASTAEADCATLLANAATLNAPSLFHGAGACHIDGRNVAVSFLIIAGQARTMADLSMLEPASQNDKTAASGLYGLVFYFFGGTGDVEVLRDPASRASLFTMLDEWSPAYDEDYSPGWQVGERPDADAYQARLAETLAARQGELEEIARAYSDEEYYALLQELNELEARNNGVFIEGTPDHERANQLQQQMDERASELGVFNH
jgi:hypothetical protein